jgi:hypothetical protein
MPTTGKPTVRGAAGLGGVLAVGMAESCCDGMAGIGLWRRRLQLACLSQAHWQAGIVPEEYAVASCKVMKTAPGVADRAGWAAGRSTFTRG